VALDAAHRHHKTFGDVTIRQARNDQLDDLTLPSGERLAGRAAQRRGAQAPACVAEFLGDRGRPQASLALLGPGEHDRGLRCGVGGGSLITDGTVVVGRLQQLLTGVGCQ
jgi:hypothetical protein